MRERKKGEGLMVEGGNVREEEEVLVEVEEEEIEWRNEVKSGKGGLVEGKG